MAARVWAVLGVLAGMGIAGAAAGQELAARIDAIVRAAMERDHLKAALVGISVDGAQELHAWGESMTGVPATPDMHFRNGAVAIAYLGTLLLQLHDKGAIELDAPVGDLVPGVSRGGPGDAADADHRHVGLRGLRYGRGIPRRRSTPTPSGLDAGRS